MEGGELGHAQFLGQDMTAMHWGWAEEDTVVRKAEPGVGLTLVHIKSPQSHMYHSVRHQGR